MYCYSNSFACPMINRKLYRMNRMEDMEFEIPHIPILGRASMREIICKVYDSVVDEATAVDFYVRLVKDTPDKLAKDFIDHAAEDEAKHLKAFTELYAYLTGQRPRYTINPVEFDTYKSGVLRALNDELEAAKFYKNTILSTSDHLVRETFFFAMIDELEHATRFSTLYNID